MNLSQSVADRSRNVNATRDFSHLREDSSHLRDDSNLPRDDSSRKDAGISSAPVVTLPWKPAIFGRIRAGLRGARHHVMEALVRLSDATDGTCWVSMETLAREARVDIKTARKHVHALVKVRGFLTAESMTWAQLCAHRRAAGRRVPHQDNDRNATYLFTVLDGVGRRGCDLPEAERGQHFGARWGRPPRRAQGSRRRVTPEPKTSDLARHEGYQIWQSRGLPNLAPELSDDPSDQEMSVLVPTSGTDAEQHTSLVSSSSEEGETWRLAWDEVHAAYAKHYRRVYQATPKTPRRLKAEDPKEAGEYLTEKARGLAVRLNVPQQEAVRMLADRALWRWLDGKGSGGFLERAGHPLWAFCEEVQGRVNQAFKALVREHVASTKAQIAEKTPQTTASWAEIDAARRQCMEKLGLNSDAPSRQISRPDLHPEPEKAADVSRSEIRRVERLIERPVERPVERLIERPERSKAPAPPLPRRNEALPPLPRPESVRSGPRWGEVDHRPVRVRRTWTTESTDEAEPDEPHPRE